MVGHILDHWTDLGRGEQSRVSSDVIPPETVSAENGTLAGNEDQYSVPVPVDHHRYRGKLLLEQGIGRFIRFGHSLRNGRHKLPAYRIAVMARHRTLQFSRQIKIIGSNTETTVRAGRTFRPGRSVFEILLFFFFEYEIRG
jgi:hypothetical protein